MEKRMLLELTIDIENAAEEMQEMIRTVLKFCPGRELEVLDELDGYVAAALSEYAELSIGA